MGGEDFLGIGNSMKKKQRRLQSTGMCGGLQVLSREWGERLIKSLGPDYARLKCWAKEFGLCSMGTGDYFFSWRMKSLELYSWAVNLIAL